MKKNYLLILFTFLLCFDLSADGGTIIIKGAKEKTCVYNSLIGREQKKFNASGNEKKQIISIPEDQCDRLLYLIVGGKTSWVRVKPQETVTVNVAKSPWKFSGDSKQINSYLYGWTQDFWTAKPNMLIGRLQIMMNELPGENKGWAKPHELYTPENIAWVKDWEKNALASLEKAGLKDPAFIAQQKELIRNAWLELQFANYQTGKETIRIPRETMEFIRGLRFEKDQLLQYPAWNMILSTYFDMADQIGLIDFTADDFLQKRASRITDPKLREAYILNELRGPLNYGIYYRGDTLLASVKNMILSAEGKQQWQKLMDQYREWVASEENPVGKNLTNFNFEDYYGKDIYAGMFKGKYLLIDIWATWCGPCTYQIPYLKKLMEDMEGRDIRFLSISVDKQKDKEKWKNMLKEHGMEDHGVIAPDAFNHNLFQNYKITSIPRFILVDPNGKIVTDKARRPSDIVLKKQLEQLLGRFDRNKITVMGETGLKDGEIVNIMEMGAMAKTVGTVKAKGGKFNLTAEIKKPGLYYLGCGREFNGEIWMQPGQKIGLTTNGGIRFTGDNAGFNNLMVQLTGKYKTRPDGKKITYDNALGKKLRETYNGIEREITASGLSEREKQIMKGYWQGYILREMCSPLRRSGFGKNYKAPEIKKGYTAAFLDMELLPELTYCSGWNDLLQEYLYVRMEAGKIKIRNRDSWLADMAGNIKNEDLREAYIMTTLYYDILRGYLRGIEARIESVRPWVKKNENIALLDAMPAQIAKERGQIAGSLPGTNLSGYQFENEKGQTVSLKDFKGKYTFIDLWSTGCRPCVAEIPYIKQIEHRFEGQPIAWVSISLDSDKQTWLDFLRENNMTGTQLLCPKSFKHPFPQKIGLSGIPRFLILDKEGCVIDPQSLRPSNPILEKTLRFILSGK